MLAQARNSHCYHDWVEYIDVEAVRDAFRYFIGLAAEDPRFTCHPQMKGEIRDFRFYDVQGEQPFSFITNKRWLLFYFRKPALRTFGVTKTELSAIFDTVDENPRGELTVKLSGIGEVQRLWRLTRSDAA